MNDAYGELEQLFGRTGRLEAAEAQLHWDMETMMPAGAASDRAEQLATLAATVHAMETAPQVGEWIERAEQDAAVLDAWQQANLREIRRRYDHRRAVPGELVEALSRVGTQCAMVWREARPQNDFARLVPHLRQVVELVRQKAQVKAELLGGLPYDLLIDEYQDGWTMGDLDALFADLKRRLPTLLEDVIAKQARQPEPLPPQGRFSRDRQHALALEMMRTLGFDFEHGRLDVSAHPFCGGTPDDVRITTRYQQDDFTSGLMGVLHETGHALYEQGLPATWRYQPVGQARGMALHESQSLIIEMQVCRSRAFLGWVAGHLREAFGGDGPAWSVDNLRRHYHRVQRSLIRVDADEVTYPIHVVMRYELEQELIAGRLEVADLPGAWADGLEQLLGIRPDDDRDGCMQDIHWMEGVFGYFPTYTLGAVIAAQLFQAALKAEPLIPASIAQGDFSLLVEWLRARVHEQGCLLSPHDLLVSATGSGLNAACYVDHLERRYLRDG